MILTDNQYIFTDIITKLHRILSDENQGKANFPTKTAVAGLLYYETFRDKEFLADRSLRGGFKRV